MLDFEKAIHNACNIIFPETTLVGCLFHLGQNLWRKAQEFYFATAYRNDEDLRMRVKMIFALSFVPIQDVPEDFEDFRWMHRKIWHPWSITGKTPILVGREEDDD